ncbi:MAG: phosphoethanolamine--lipid A transferase [Gammaproteobacteria bacterium]|nr:phosphoethanolamine--lipid A transferase [Gammaproteobacteria bacterium]
MISDNQRFYSSLSSIIGTASIPSALLYLVVVVILFSSLYLLLSLFAIKHLTKPILILMLISSSLTGYFLDTYNVIIDDRMIQNVADTDSREATELLSWKMLAYLVFFGLLPATIVVFTKLKYKPFTKHLLWQGGYITASLAIVSLLAIAFYKDLSIIGREHHELRYYMNPSYPLYSLARFTQTTSAHDAPVRLTPIGTEARQASTWQKRGKKSVFIFVVGETARARHFSLGGYARDTNRYTREQNVIFFNNVSSCGTSTAESVPCMFSLLGRSDYSIQAASEQENLLDVLKHANIDVLWRDNNSGCKGVCDRVAQEDVSSLKIPELCRPDECYDEILLNKLQDYLDKAQGDVVIVLHQKGSHGPAYSKRHPPSFTEFTPECQQDQVQSCEQQTIVNAYDNTILYTDYFLAHTIKLLKNNAKTFNSAMLYVSDHGESLGENGIYLHGLPYMIAPEDQKHVPMMLWLSDGYKQAYGIDETCLRQNSAREYSHDNLFHSVLGLLDVKTSVYKADQDISHACRKHS